MADKLKPGNLSAAVSVNDSKFDGSMAALIEHELDVLMQADGLDKLSMDNDDRSVRDRRRLFVAIARGVVKHLVANTDAFKLQTTGAGGLTTKLNSIDTVIPP